MKTLNITLLLSSLIVATITANELKWVDKQIEAIKPAREGISNKRISSLKDPFIFLIDNEIKKKDNSKIIIKRKKYTKNNTKPKYYKAKAVQTNIKFKLEAVINKTALINTKWYKIGEKIKTYTLKEVNLHQVVLTKGSSIIVLSTNTQNRTLKFKNK